MQRSNGHAGDLSNRSPKINLKDGNQPAPKPKPPKLAKAYMRSDIPMFHTIVRAKGGSVFTLDGHFDQCEVCKEHKVTLADFEAFMSG